MGERRITYLLLLLICTATIANLSFAASPLNLTVATDKPSYILREVVDIFGNATYEGQPVEEGLVGIQVENPLSNLVVRTVPAGSIPERRWGIEVVSVKPCDSAGKLKESFEKRSWVYFQVKVKNNDPVSQDVLITVNVYDGTLIPLGLKYSKTTIGAGLTTTFMPAVWIDKWASPGNAITYANVYTDWPKHNGRPYSPEKTTNYTIIESEYEEPPHNEIPEQQIQNGWYNLQFQLSSEPLPGQYQISVSAWYKGWTAFDTTTFQVEDVAAPPRATFIAKPPIAALNMTITFDASYSSPEGYDDSITSYTWDFGDGEQATGIQVQHSYSDLGNYTVTLNVTDSEGFWNTTSKIVSVAVINDVALTNIKFLDEIYSRWLVELTVTAKNKGTTPETFSVTAYYNSSIIGTKTITNLGVLQQVDVTYEWNTTGLTPYTNYIIKAEADIVPNETETADNQIVYGTTKVKALGDVVEPYRKIDIYDVACVCVVYGSKPGDPNWYIQADLAPDYGVIDIYDIAVVCSRYGKTY